MKIRIIATTMTSPLAIRHLIARMSVRDAIIPEITTHRIEWITNNWDADLTTHYFFSLLNIDRYVSN
jgi:hypothetical protein